MPIVTVRDVDGLRSTVAGWRAKGLKTAIVPTMGALHEGHLKLVRRGFDLADKVVTSIFVNPKQFAANEDLSRYPRDEEGDLKKLKSEGVDLVYAPAPEEVYPDGFATNIHMQGPASAGLEDKFRPQFFDGVATVVAKLFTASTADYAIFGEKDYQQLMVVTRMARDLNLPTQVIGVETEREEDGLAMSSRNAYLSKHERQQAVSLHRNLTQAAEKIRGGAKPQTATQSATRSLETLGFKVDYFTARNAETLALVQGANEPIRLLVAAWLGKTRLIDNIAV
ncbi:pantoate--beta-alanine ligase [Aestuariivirga litoralis]|uniref:pantoate--beta-alanine ligase n=1 Tax=Aestuariivirga litoralis TaxID=2650924 RepID=UPI0018C506B3|nr:pantoate--beta-alanine ligase [Aestuariivirga litoralis]MBG1231359.1 pantoate--beta-alanine ligase [Aestuariivirga litoralis]